MSSSKVGSRRSTGHEPAGPSCPMIVSPCQRRRISPAKSSICAVVTRPMPKASCIISMPRPIPRVKRPPVSRCIVVAYDAVTSGCRVLWFVAAVAMPMRSVIAPAAPESVAASLML